MPDYTIVIFDSVEGLETFTRVEIRAERYEDIPGLFNAVIDLGISIREARDLATWQRFAFELRKHDLNLQTTERLRQYLWEEVVPLYPARPKENTMPIDDRVKLNLIADKKYIPKGHTDEELYPEITLHPEDFEFEPSHIADNTAVLINDIRQANDPDKWAELKKLMDEFHASDVKRPSQNLSKVYKILQSMPASKKYAEMKLEDLKVVAYESGEDIGEVLMPRPDPLLLTAGAYNTAMKLYEEQERRLNDRVKDQYRERNEELVKDFGPMNEIMEDLAAPYPVKSDDVNHPSHYNTYTGIEIIDITEKLSPNRGNAVKYIARAGKKAGANEIQDLEKALWYTTRALNHKDEWQFPELVTFEAVDLLVTQMNYCRGNAVYRLSLAGRKDKSVETDLTLSMHFIVSEIERLKRDQ